MFVRIARFEGSDPAEAEQSIAGVRQMVESDRPAGLEGASRFLMLVDRQSGRGLGVTFYDDEEKMPIFNRVDPNYVTTTTTTVPAPPPETEPQDPEPDPPELWTDIYAEA